MINLDYRDKRPLYEQITEKFENLISSGALGADEQLPSVRQLAMELSINPNTIQRSYMELEKKNIIYSIKGKGNFVTSDTEAIRRIKTENLMTDARNLALKAAELNVPLALFVKEFEKSYLTARGDARDD
ncbi:MAG: GntR family transcriptional regulator [Bacillota bacterium]|nr:GntR family transcriptional regulator [Bacillota bacterium]